ncbi:Tetraspanin [Entomortierella chlamydospora]|nr:Tetraspanin [Entomortierella chlamydospora]
MSQCLYSSNVVDIPRVDPLSNDRDSYQTVSLTDVLTKILTQSPLLRRLGRLQQALDSLDVETIHRFYTQLADPITGAVPDPTMEEYLDTAEAFMYRTDMNDMMAKDHEIFLSNNATSLGFGPEDDLDDEDVVPRSLKLHYIREFLLSATLKDCSILITVRQVEEEEEEVKAGHSLPKNDVSSVKGISLGFREKYHWINVNDKEFIYKITCIDLDPKKMSSVPMYLKKDRDIVNYYLSTIGDRESSCTFVYFAPGAVFVTSTLLPHLILVLGATISLVSFLGYYGAMNEKRWILWIHVLTLLIAIALQITVGAIAFVYRDHGNEVLDNAWERVYKTDPRVIQDLESFFQCCGFEHVFDRPVPVTCAIDHHFMVGCRESIQTAFQDSLQAIGVIGAILGGIELVSLLGATVLFHRFDKQKYRRECEAGEADLVQAFLEAQHIDRQIEEARRQRERQLGYESLADQVRAKSLARAHEEGLFGPRDPPAYGTF